MIHRVKDRAPQIRLSVLSGCAKAYNKYISSKWGRHGQSIADDLPQDLQRKLGWVPEIVILTYLGGDQKTRTTVLEVGLDSMVIISYSKTTCYGVLLLMPQGVFIL